jgi:hypothetical protein
MTLEEEIAEVFKKHGWTWNLKGGKTLVPEPHDIEAALDESARLLYNEKPGDQLEVGRLIVQRKHNGFDVYVYAGTYE